MAGDRGVRKLPIVIAGSPFDLMAYIIRREGGNEVAVVAGDLASMAYEVSRNGVVTASGSLDPADVMHDPPITGTAWDGGRQGFNFLAKIPGSAIPTPGKTYGLELSYTFTGGDTHRDIFYVPTMPEPS